MASIARRRTLSARGFASISSADAFCAPRIAKDEKPACVAACPREAMTFGKRNELIPIAHEKIKQHEGRYVDHVYGEKEVGGTSWMYLSPVKFEQAGFLSLGEAAPPALTEHIQHGVFKHWIAPITWYSFLLAMFFRTGRNHHAKHAHAKPAASAAGKFPAAEAAGLASHSAPHQHGKHAAVPHKLLTPGVWALLSIVLIGIGFWIYRMSVGLAASTNLSQQRPWGLWIAMVRSSGTTPAS